MKNIVCPSCGSVKISVLENDKAVCLACDNVFTIHDYSKEFEKTSLKMDKNKEELLGAIESIKESHSMANQDTERFDRLLEKAATYIKLRDKKKAIACATEATELMPEKAIGYIVLYHAWTDVYRETGAYEIMLNTKKSAEASKIADTIKKALKCPDCPTSFRAEVTEYLRKCADCAVNNVNLNYAQKEMRLKMDVSLKEGKYKAAFAETKSKLENIKKDKKNLYIKYIAGAIGLLILGLSLGISEIFTLLAIIGGIIYVGYMGGKKLIKREVDDVKKTLIIMALLIFVAPLVIIGLADSLGEIMDILCLGAGAFLLLKSGKKKINIRASELNEELETALPPLEKQWENAKAIAAKEMKLLNDEKGLYTQILADAELNDKGLTLINNYLQSKYMRNI